MDNIDRITQTDVDALWLACRVDIGAISDEPNRLRGEAQLRLQRLMSAGIVSHDIGTRPIINKPDVEINNISKIIEGLSDTQKNTILKMTVNENTMGGYGTDCGCPGLIESIGVRHSIYGSHYRLTKDGLAVCNQLKQECNHIWNYVSTDSGGSHKGEDFYKCIICPATKYEIPEN